MAEEGEKRPETDITIKLLLIGSACVGKTLLVQKFIDNSFSENTISTIGVDLQSKIIDINGKKVKYLIWDTAGEERLKTLTYSYYRGCHVILIIFDVTDRNSFSKIDNWIECIDKFAKRNVLKLLVGNKIDLDDKRVVSKDEGKQIAQKYRLKYYEISALKIENLYEMLEDAAKEFVEIYEQKSMKSFQLKKQKRKEINESDCCY